MEKASYATAVKERSLEVRAGEGVANTCFWALSHSLHGGTRKKKRLRFRRRVECVVVLVWFRGCNDGPPRFGWTEGGGRLGLVGGGSVASFGTRKRLRTRRRCMLTF